MSTKITGLCVGLTAVFATIADSYELDRHTIDGGGATTSAAGGFELSGTIGQPDAGISAGGAYEVFGGFWFPIVDGDCNADGGINLFDYADFGACLSGPGGGFPQPQCACFDFDDDGDVDLVDFGGLQVAVAGN